MESVLDARTVYIILHIFGAVIGAGGAFMSDAMFFSSVKDRKIGREEIRLLKVGSRMVWLGLLILFISGALLFSLDPATYITSSKFLVKMTIVLVIVLNGLVFHYYHLPLISRHCELNLPDCPEFIQKSPLLMASGVISTVSWGLTIILGVLRAIPYSYVTGMLIYIGILVVGIIVVLLLRERVLFARR